MGYLIFELIVYLLIAAAIGVVIGLYIHHAYFDEALRKERDDAKRLGDEASGKLAGLRKKLKAMTKARDEARDEHAECEPKYAKLEAEVVALEDQLEELRGMHDEDTSRLDGLANVQARVPELEAELSGRDAKMSALEAKVEDWRGKYEQQRTKTKAATKENERTTARLDMKLGELLEQRRRVDELERKIANRALAAPVSSSVPKLAPKGGTAAADLRKQLQAARDAHSGCDDKIRALSADVGLLRARVKEQEETRPPGWVMVKPRGEADDLKQIRGIGPVLEGTLNTLGIHHFWQIARFEPTDVEWVASRIDAFPDRIRRDEWVKQAAQFAGESSTDVPVAKSAQGAAE